ncbi:hypothetical protein [Apilactobacillus ozensis]|nr:hypothetical protein [Apilactobacillus ozensis]
MYYTLTQRSRMVKQPYGGYLPVRTFNKTQFDDSKKIKSDEENISASLVGLAVDYLTRFCQHESFESAFAISLMGIKNYQIVTHDTVDLTALEVKGLDDASIINACKLATFDVWYRNPRAAVLAKENYELCPNSATINNIKVMVQRTLDFFEQYEPIVENGFVMPGGYTTMVSTGDGDYLTTHTLVDLKVSKNNITNKYTLQIAMYYLMGRHSTNQHFQSINTLAIFNPRLNMLYSKSIDEIDANVLSAIEYDVIGY